MLNFYWIGPSQNYARGFLAKKDFVSWENWKFPFFSSSCCSHRCDAMAGSLIGTTRNGDCVTGSEWEKKTVRERFSQLASSKWDVFLPGKYFHLLMCVRLMIKFTSAWVKFHLLVIGNLMVMFGLSTVSRQISWSDYWSILTFLRTKWNQWCFLTSCYFVYSQLSLLKFARKKNAFGFLCRLEICKIKITCLRLLIFGILDI